MKDNTIPIHANSAVGEKIVRCGRCRHWVRADEFDWNKHFGGDCTIKLTRYQLENLGVCSKKGQRKRSAWMLPPDEWREKFRHTNLKITWTIPGRVFQVEVPEKILND